MKQSVFLILTLCSTLMYGQYYGNYHINFDNEYGLENLFIDTISNDNNIWEIGAPDKIVFDSAYSLPNAICTDTANSYPVNDTSVFLIRNLADGGFEKTHTVILGGRYKIDSDTLKDFGKIEFSPDNGVTWVDLLTDTVYSEKGCYDWWSEKPTFTGKTDGWKEFYVWLAGFGWEFDIGGWDANDTVIYRFTFISDSVQTNRDGWILDDLHFEDYYESIEERGFNSFNSSVFPNPAHHLVNIEFSNEASKNYNISIYDVNGRLTMSDDTRTGLIQFDLSNLSAGVYFYRIKFENNISLGKILRK